MKSLHNYFLALVVAAATMTAFTSCEETPAVEGGDDDSTTTPPVEVPTPVVSSVEVDAASITVSSASIEVKYADIAELCYSYNVVGDEENVVSKTVEVEAETTSYTIELTDLEAYTAYEIKVYGVNSEETSSEEVSQSFKTLIPENDFYSIENIVISPSSASFDLTLKEGCEGVVFYVADASGFNAGEVNNMIDGGYARYITESGNVSVFDYAATPSTLYNYILVPVENIREVDSEWGGKVKTCDIIGSVEDSFVRELTTGDYDKDFVIANATADTISMSIVSTEITQIVVDLKRNENENVVAAYCGAVKTAELGEMTAAEWAVENKFFNNAMINYFVTVDMNAEKVQVYLSNLADETEYTLFMVPVTASGAFGKTTTATATTKGYDVTVNEDLKPTVEIVAGLNSAQAKITFGDCAKVFYDEYSTNIDMAKAALYQNAIYGSYFFSAADWGTEVTYDIPSLESGKEYKFYAMGVDKDGVYGAICEYTFTTTSLNWDGKTTATVTQVSATYNEYNDAVVVFKIDLSDDTKKATIAGIDKAYIVNDVPKAWGSYILNNTYYNQYLEADGEVTVTFMFHQDYKLVVVTEDEAGAYGAPIVVDIDWTSIDPYVAPVE